jgi:peptidoglycan L-alanyl-D-glutamate endopeptidase CwlK
LATSTDIFSGLNPELITKVRGVLDKMTELGHPMKVVQGFRSVAQQQALYAQGRTKPGKRVTNADGVRVKSNHQSGNAVDCAFLVNGKVSWEGPWDLFGSTAESFGLKWGGRWKTLVDRPHLEL